MLSKETLRLLNHPAMQPFWDDVRRIRNSQMKKLMEDEEVQYVKAVKAIDNILKLPENYKIVVDSQNDE